MKEFIEIPFGAKDSELGGWEYNIPEGYTASIENGKIIVKKEEDKDEKIREMLISFVKNDCIIASDKNKQDALAWLEKQDTKVSVYRDTLFKIATVLSQYEDKDDSPLKKIRSIMIDGTICSMDLESKNKKQGEQKPTDKVEPKFKAGDWLVNNEYYNIVKVLEVNEQQYKLDYCGLIGTMAVKFIDNEYHLWTIQDAKKGDILQAIKCTLIFDSLTKDIDNKTAISSWYFCDSKRFYGMGTSEPDLWDSIGIVPATKEQRDALFARMKEAGYEWDAENKVLKKIEQKPTWSEDDENRFRNLIYLVEHSDEGSGTKRGFIKFINRLKSLKERYTWKPSDEQMNTLEYYMHTLVCSEHKEILFGLYADLKKLMKE